MKRAVRGIKRTTGLGDDCFTPDELRDMPTEGWRQLTGLLQRAERECVLPVHEMRNAMTTRPKPIRHW